MEKKKNTEIVINQTPFFSKDELIIFLEKKQKEREEKEKKIFSDRIKAALKGKEMVFENHSSSCNIID